jgi:hypothetical protein
MNNTWFCNQCQEEKVGPWWYLNYCGVAITVSMLDLPVLCPDCGHQMEMGFAPSEESVEEEAGE